MALGPVILGYGYPAVDDAIRAQLKDGITFTLPHPLEVEVAERIAAVVPNAERVRFAKSGSDVTSAAIRLARAVTGRDHVLVAGYHGWHDWYIGSTSRHRVPRAVRDLVEVVRWGDLKGMRAAFMSHQREVAAVILEPVGVTEPAANYLQGVIEIAHEHGALAIFDEVITGFRLAPGGAQERYAAIADLATFGKALGNGMPISALAGRAATMDAFEEVFFSGTHGGETLSLAAARATLDVLSTEPVYEHLWRWEHAYSKACAPPSRAIASSNGWCVGAPRRGRSSACASRSRGARRLRPRPCSNRRCSNTVCSITARTS